MLLVLLLFVVVVVMVLMLLLPAAAAAEIKPSTHLAPRDQQAPLALTESSVRAELQRNGGRMKAKAMLKRFMKLLKTGEDKKRLKEIIKRLTRMEQDPIQGKVLVLQSLR